MPKISRKDAATDDTSTATNGSTAVTTATPSPAKKRTKSAKTPAAKKSSAKKKSGSAAAKKTRTKRAPQPTGATEPSDADIRLRAYFIAERRVQLALQGDPAKDWLDARQQLIEEARQGQA